MVFSTFQFLVTTLLAVVCARAISLSEGDIPILALLIPALWVLPQGGVKRAYTHGRHGDLWINVAISTYRAFCQRMGIVPSVDGRVFKTQ